MAISPFMAAINQICDEKNLSRDIVLETIEAAIAAAYRKDFGKPSQIIKIKLDPESGETKVWQVFDIVERAKAPRAFIQNPYAETCIQIIPEPVDLPVLYQTVGNGLRYVAGYNIPYAGPFLVASADHAHK